MSIKIALVTLALSTALLTSACATSDKSMASTSADAAIAAADAARKAAAKVGNEWRDTGKMIKQAKKLAKEGNTEDAIQLAKKAEEQGKDAVAQFKSETARYEGM